MKEHETHRHRCVDEITTSIVKAARKIQALWSKHNLRCDDVKGLLNNALWKAEELLDKVADEIQDELIYPEE